MLNLEDRCPRCHRQEVEAATSWVPPARPAERPTPTEIRSAPSAVLPQHAGNGDAAGVGFVAIIALGLGAFAALLFGATAGAFATTFMLYLLWPPLARSLSRRSWVRLFVVLGWVLWGLTFLAGMLMSKSSLTLITWLVISGFAYSGGEAAKTVQRRRRRRR
jgi:hypothetical protein